VHLVFDDDPRQARRKPGPGEVDVAPAEARELDAAHVWIAERNPYERAAAASDTSASSEDDEAPGT
jgi:hypothetical protein